MALERRPLAPIDASRGDDERVFDSLHRAGIDIKLVGNPTNGFSSLQSCKDLLFELWRYAGPAKLFAVVLGPPNPGADSFPNH